ncbi:copper resistance protein CopC [Rhodococcus sp. 1R11]|uniref:copper resistance CopC family protein n=1 Tax=unclassified Rhodococcus (in: high G+C Gram-positive bacteria) TaxID=192944 RepID=UPI00107283D1|nr:MULTISPECIES: copper resistance CopC family protein [unclassified Rhodococcus (in: high G+C Gram-positive bacteria)]TFI40967.1 copper resistance protein CopC [Rhodococcus sp. 1R11]
MRRLMLIAVMICGTALFAAAPASAHSELVSSDPPADATLEFAPIGVGLVFNQDINESFATISVVGPGDTQWAQGTATVEGPDVSVLLQDGLPNGEYTVGYRVTSADGHPITGSYGFSVDVAATATPQDAAAQQSQSGATSTSPTPATTATQPYDPNNPSASEDRPPKQNTMMLLSIVGITVIALAAIALTLVIRGKNKQ